MMKKARSASTNSKRNTAWRSWSRFCREHKWDRQALSEQKIVFYVTWMALRNYKLSTCRQYLSAVLIFFSLVGHTTSLEDLPRVRLALDGYKRMSPKATQKRKLRITTTILRKLQPHVRQQSPKERVIWALMVTATQGLFRLGELTVRSADDTDYLTWAHYRTMEAARGIFLPDSKTDWLRRGVEIILADLPQQICAPPLLDALRGSASSADPMFAVKGKPVTRNMVLSLLKTLLRRANIQSSASGHSFRQGGAQSLFDAGLSIEDIKIFGRWKSDAFRAYIEMWLARVASCHSRMAAAPPSGKWLVL